MTVRDYRASLRQAVRGMINGILSVNEFEASMTNGIQRNLQRAWVEGSKTCGITANDLTPEETNALNNIIFGELTRVLLFADYINILKNDDTKKRRDKLNLAYARLDKWILRYTDATNKGKIYACKNKKLVWRRGGTRRGCRTCSALDGVVKRADTWKKLGVFPQSPPNERLFCRGYGCLCTVQETDLPVTKGRLPGVKESLYV